MIGWPFNDSAPLPCSRGMDGRSQQQAHSKYRYAYQRLPILLQLPIYCHPPQPADQRPSMRLDENCSDDVPQRMEVRQYTCCDVSIASSTRVRLATGSKISSDRSCAMCGLPLWC